MQDPPQATAQLCFQQGRQARRSGDSQAAIHFFEQAIRLQEDHVPAYNNLANLLQELGRVAEAVALYQKALTLAPGKAVLHCNLASLHQIQDQPALAQAGYEQALRLDPGFFLAHHNLGKLFASQKKLRPAEAALKQALRLKPESGEAHLDLGNLYRQQGRYEETVASYRAAVRHSPKSAQALSCLGAILQQRGEVKVSMACYRRALKLDPRHDIAHFNLGMLLESLGRLPEARQHYEAALALQPQALNVLYHLEYLRLKLADWQDYEQRQRELAERSWEHLRGERMLSLPMLSLLAFRAPIELQAAVARHIGKGHAQAAGALQEEAPKQAPEPAPDRLRIGYVSPDFRRHAVGTLIHQMFAHHQRPDFEIFAYSLAPIEDEWTQTIRCGCDHYSDVSSLSPLAIAERVRADGIHVLVDLAGYTTNSVTTLFALRPAPMQIQYLGYPGTMGADFIDCIVADDMLIPPELAQHYSEKVLRLPHAWVAAPMDIAASPASRAECGLPQEGMVYCCFNSTYKISPEVFAAWMRILQRVPGSVLWLSDPGQPIVLQRLRQQAQAHGVEPSRLLFGANLPHEQYLARYRLADLFLDTFIYNAGATAVGALWAGLPVLTCPGQGYASRMGAGLCSAVGMTDMICASPQAYEDLAVTLGHDAARLQAVKVKLEQALIDAPLFKPQLFVRNLEQALRRAWEERHT